MEVEEATAVTNPITDIQPVTAVTITTTEDAAVAVAITYKNRYLKKVAHTAADVT